MIRTSIFKPVFAAAAFALAASAHADVTVLSEGFTGGAPAPGWIQTNAVAGQQWFPGFESAFPAQSGPPDSYIAANFLTAAGPSGDFDLWLISPEVMLHADSALSFYTRAADPGWMDQLEVRYSAGSGVNVSTFTTLLNTIGAGGSYPTDWQRFTTSLGSGFEGSGRFAFRYTGNTASADFIGIDSVKLTTVPEPGSIALLGLGAAGFVLARRKQRRG